MYIYSCNEPALLFDHYNGKTGGECHKEKRGKTSTRADTKRLGSKYPMALCRIPTNTGSRLKLVRAVRSKVLLGMGFHELLTGCALSRCAGAELGFLWPRNAFVKGTF